MQKGKPAKKYSQAGRVHDVIRLIEARHGITLEELVEETGVTRRTVHRDLIAIQEAGYPLISKWIGPRKVYQFITRFKDIPPINFTLQELMTLSFLRSQLDMLQGTPFQDDMAAVYKKINSVLPPRYAAHMERVAGVTMPLLQGRRDYTASATLIAKLREALLYQKRVSIGYRAKGKGRLLPYLIDPYTLLFYKGGLYLVGYAHNRKAVRTFAVERIGTVSVEKGRFEMPEDYQPEERLKGAFGIVGEEPMRVTIRFSSEIAHAVAERVWHPSQRIVRKKGGGIVLTFEAGGKMEIIAWILSYGAHAEVLEPVELRDEVAAIVGKMGAHYRTESPDTRFTLKPALP